MDAELRDDYSARVPFATVLASIAGLWLCYFLLTTLRWELLGLDEAHIDPRASRGSNVVPIQCFRDLAVSANHGCQGPNGK